METKAERNLGRNDICYCGSGKKFKYCCIGKEEEAKKAKEQLNNSLQEIRQVTINLSIICFAALLCLFDMYLSGYVKFSPKFLKFFGL